jgi:hypothetical protein
MDFYFIYTNDDINDSNVNVKTGLNINKSKKFMVNNFSEDKMNNFTDSTVNFTDKTVSKYKYIRIISVPSKDNEIYSFGYSIYVNKLISSDRYYLYDPLTIKRFNIKVNASFAKGACANGAVKFLEWWKNSGLKLEYDHTNINSASGYGHVNVLTWWRNSGLELKYTEYALNEASFNGHINVLEWWKNSGLELKYSQKTIHKSVIPACNISVLKWWANSGLLKD